MTTPVDVINVMWITLPFLFASILFALQACKRNLSVNRVILMSACVFSFCSNLGLIVMLGGIQTSFSILTQVVGYISYNLGLSTARLYVCLRMAQLSPSPTMATSFIRLAYFIGISFVVTLILFTKGWIEFYETHPPDILAPIDEGTVVSASVANLIFAIASACLHFKILKMFTNQNYICLQLYILSGSTLTAIFFGLIQGATLINDDTMTELMMAGMQVAVLPSSIVLGEAIAIQIGRRADKVMATLCVESSPGRATSERSNLP